MVSPAAHACTKGERTSSAASSGTRPINANSEAITKATMRPTRERRLGLGSGRTVVFGLGRGVVVAVGGGRSE